MPDQSFIPPGEYGGMFLGGNGNFRSEERGGIEQYDFNISFNINDRVYLGVTVGAYAIDYNKYTFYSEDYLANPILKGEYSKGRTMAPNFTSKPEPCILFQFGFRGRV